MTLRYPVVLLLLLALVAIRPVGAAMTSLTIQQRWALSAGAIIPLRNGQNIQTLDLQPLTDTKTVLQRDWGIDTSQKAKDMLKWLGEVGHNDEYRHMAALSDPELTKIQAGLQHPKDDKLSKTIDVFRSCHTALGDRGLIAWDESRLIFVARASYSCGLLSEAETWEAILGAARKLQQTCSSWDQLGDDYVMGRRFWDPDGDQSSTIKVVEQLKHDAYSPWQKLNWKQAL